MQQDSSDNVQSLAIWVGLDLLFIIYDIKTRGESVLIFFFYWTPEAESLYMPSESALCGKKGFPACSMLISVQYIAIHDRLCLGRLLQNSWFESEIFWQKHMHLLEILIHFPKNHTLEKRNSGGISWYLNNLSITFLETQLQFKANTPYLASSTDQCSARGPSPSLYTYQSDSAPF